MPQLDLLLRVRERLEAMYRTCDRDKYREAIAATGFTGALILYPHDEHKAALYACGID